ncbi:hypothetical protein OB920_12655 [Halobacteria archaeon HArc-gm2]|nr:hypothetical protein [Halobacteria archaeon HArc-gm2]
MTDAPDIDGESVDEAERLAASSEVHANAWQRTLDDMWALEEEFQDEGWETLVTAAGHTAAVTPSHEKGYWGLTHIVPDSDAEAIGDAVESADFPRYDVYRTLVDGRVFSVTALLDPEAETAVLVSNQFELRRARPLVEHAREAGHVNTVVRFLDGTVVAQARHDDPGKFFPRYETFGDDEA